MNQQLPEVPAAVTAALDNLKKELSRAAGDNLAGLILYGGVARGRYRPGKSDVNVVVLLNDLSEPALAAVAPVLMAASRAAAIEPMLLSPVEVPRAAEAFPTKFLDIKNHHIVLLGVDPFASITVTRSQLIDRAIQELQNLAMRLRRRYIAASGDESMLAQALDGVARPFAIMLASLLKLAGTEVSEEDRTAAIFGLASTAFGLPDDALARLAELRQNTRPAGDSTDLFPGVIASVAKAIDAATAMKEKP